MHVSVLALVGPFVSHGRNMCSRWERGLVNPSVANRSIAMWLVLHLLQDVKIEDAKLRVKQAWSNLAGEADAHKA